MIGNFTAPKYQIKKKKNGDAKIVTYTKSGNTIAVRIENVFI